MDMLERIAKNNDRAARIAAYNQPYVFWQNDLDSISKELPNVPRLPWTQKLERQCDAWGSPITALANLEETFLASFIGRSLWNHPHETLGVVLTPSTYKPGLYHLRILRKHHA